MVIVLIALFSCEYKKEHKTGKVNIVDSLGWQDNPDYAFTGLCTIESYNDELFVLSTYMSEFYVYDINTLEYKRKFGTKGKGPGEIRHAYYFTFDNDGSVVVADEENNRITWFTREGEYIKSLKASAPTVIHNYDGTLYYANISTNPKYGIYKISGNKKTRIFNLKQLSEDIELPLLKRNMDFLIKDQSTYIAFHHYPDKVFKFEANNLCQLSNSCMDYPFGGTDICEGSESFSQVQYSIARKDNNLILNTAQECADQLGLAGKLVDYSYNGDIICEYALPEKIYCHLYSFNRNDNVVFMQDFYSNVIYKLEIDR